MAGGTSRFLFATEPGRIFGWNPNVPVPSSRQAIVAVDRSAFGANYKGLAIDSTSEGGRLYAADFHNARIDVFDGRFNLLVYAFGAFVDPQVPHGFAPFGIQTIGSRVVVAYAKQDAQAEDEVAGPGLGFVSVFDTSGSLLGRITNRNLLNAPWGIALAPANFGRFSGSLLIGNFGDGRITAFDLATLQPKGQLMGLNGNPIAIDGLWGIAFGNGSAAGPSNALFFAAGPGDEEHGLFGRLDPR